MPGFKVAYNDDPEGVGPQPSFRMSGPTDAERNHRWKIQNLIGISVSDTSRLLYAKSLTLPNITFEEETVNGGSINYKIPKNVTYSDVTMEFYDVHGLYDELYKKTTEVWTPTGGIKIANDYMGITIFSTTQANGSVSGTWTLRNSYIKELSNSTLAYDNSEIKTVSVTIGFSWLEYDAFPVKQSREENPWNNIKPIPPPKGPDNVKQSPESYFGKGYDKGADIARQAKDFALGLIGARR